MKPFFQFRNIFALMAMVAFLGLATSCDSSDDDDSTSSGAVKFQFTGGKDSTDSAVTDGEDSVASSNIALSDSSSNVQDGKLPEASVGVQLCSFTLEKTNSPTITLFDTAGAFTGGSDAKATVDLLVTALADMKFTGDSAADKLQGTYKFEVSTTGTAAAGKLNLKVTPKLNVAYVPTLTFHATDCAGASGHTTLVSSPFTASEGGKGKESKAATAIVVFDTDKPKQKEGQKTKDAIMVDGFVIDLPEPKQTGRLLGTHLAREINKATDAGEFEGQEGAQYQAGAYKATGERTAAKCGVTPANKWKGTHGCLVLTRVLAGAGGNGVVSYKGIHVKKAAAAASSSVGLE